MTLTPMIVQDDPLELKIKRSRYSRNLLGIIFRTPGSYLGKYSFNWMAAGALVDMIEAIFTSDESVYLERRKALRKMGMKHRPQALHFDTFRMVVNAFPMSIARRDIHAALKDKHEDLTLDNVQAALDYLKGFSVEICGFSIISDFAGGVKLADIDARMKLHIHMRNVMNGIREKETRNGVEILASLPGVKQLPAPSVMPQLDFDEKAKELPDASD